MEIMVLPDGETYGVLDGCSIRRVPDGASREKIDELIARGEGEVLVRLEDDRRRPQPSREGKQRPVALPGRVWLTNVHTDGPPIFDVSIPGEGVQARAIEGNETYYSAPAVQPLREMLERFSHDPDLGLAARVALTRFELLSGERRPDGGHD